MRSLVIWGAGGHGRVVLDVAVASERFFAYSFLDDAPARPDFCGCRVYSSLEDLDATNLVCFGAMVVAIGDNIVRARCAAMARAWGWNLATVIHPSAIISPSARIGSGTVVMPRAVVNAGAVIGENCIVNTGSIVEHDCQVGDHVHLSPGVMLGGAVTVQSFVHMGLGAIALPGSTIEQQAVVGAGAVVLHGVERGETVVGIPARRAAGSATGSVEMYL